MDQNKQMGAICHGTKDPSPYIRRIFSNELAIGLHRIFLPAYLQQQHSYEKLNWNQGKASFGQISILLSHQNW